MRRSAISPGCSPTHCRPMSRSELTRAWRKASRLWKTFPRRARSGGRASSASRDWFAGWERERRGGACRDLRRDSRENTIPLGDRIFTCGRADRIEQRADGTYAILDYKTGQPPTEPQVRTRAWRRSSRWKPRSCATAASPDIPPARWSKSVMCGSRAASRRASRRTSSYGKRHTRQLRRQRAGKARQASRVSFLIDGEPYRSLVHPMWKKHYGDYDHLARVKEWAASGGESEDGPS